MIFYGIDMIDYDSRMLLFQTGCIIRVNDRQIFTEEEYEQEERNGRMFSVEIDGIEDESLHEEGDTRCFLWDGVHVSFQTLTKKHYPSGVTAHFDHVILSINEDCLINNSFVWKW